MAKKSENVTLTISISPKLDLLIRRQALNERLNLGEMVEKYRDAYLREREREKLEKQQAEKAKSTTEQAKNGENQEKK